MARVVRTVLSLIAILALSTSAWAQQPTPDPFVTGTIAGTTSVTLQNLPSGRGTASITVSNYCTCTLVIEGRAQAGGDWEAINGAPTISSDKVYQVAASGLEGIRVRATAFTSTTTTIAIRVSSAGGGGTSSGGGGGGGDITIGGSTPDLGAGAVTANTLRVAVEDGLTSDINDIRSYTLNASDKLTSIESRLINSADYNQAAKTQGDQVMFYASDTTPTATTAGFAQRPWVDLNGRLHNAAEGIEDAGETAGGFLLMSGSVRRDTAASSAGTTGDNATINTDSIGRLWVTGTVIEDIAESGGDQLLLAGSVRRDTPTSSAGTSGDFATLNTSALGALFTATIDPCSYLSKSYAVVGVTTATTTVHIAASASNKAYICSINLGPVSAADNVAFVEDATGSCASPDAGIIGGTTAANGWNFSANGGLALGNGAATVAKTASTNVNVCTITSAGSVLPGVISYVLAP